MSAFPPEVISTPRLTLRPPEMDDVPAIFASYPTDPEVTRYLTWSPARTIADTRLFVAHAIHNWRRGAGERPWLMTRTADGGVVGMFGAEVKAFSVEIGYVLGREHWSQGYASEALGAVVDAALGDPRIWRIWAVVDIENERSSRALAKAGFEHEGTLRRFSVHPAFGPDPRDVHCYARVRT